MAKKSRTPPPPRRVQAPRARTEPELQRRRMVLYALALSGVLMLALVLVGLSFIDRGSGSSESLADPGPVMRAEGCTLRNFKGQGQTHTDDLNAKIDYNSFPPTSGTHYFQPAPWAFYEEPLSQVQVLHNLEHGGVAIQYGPETPASTRDQLQEFYREDPRGLIVGPLPALKDKIALTAWTMEAGDTGSGTGRLATCPRFSEKAFRAFLDAYRFKGPESCLEENQVRCFRPDDLEPGE